MTKDEAVTLAERLMTAMQGDYRARGCIDWWQTKPEEWDDLRDVLAEVLLDVIK